MKKILGLIWGFLKEKNRWAIALVVVLLLITGGIIKIQRNKIADWKDKYQTEVKLKDALIDSVGFYRNAYGEVVAEKLTIQESIKNLEKIYGQLSESQKELITRIKELDKKNNIIAAALITANVKIDSLLHDGKTVVDTTGKKVYFSDYYKKTKDKVTYEVAYKFTVGKVVPFPITATPTLLIDSLYFPNKQFVDFHYRDNKEKGDPISFSVSNSNGFFNTVNIDSYAIPKLVPEYKSKFGEWFNKNGKWVLVGVGGVAVGTGATYMLLK